MPIRYRQYYLQKLVEILEKQQEEMDSAFKSKNSQTPQSNKKPKEKPPIPDFAFKAKAPKK